MFNILHKQEKKINDLRCHLKSLEAVIHSASKFAYRENGNIIAKGYQDTKGVVVEEIEAYQIINHNMEPNYSTPVHYHPTNRQYMILLDGEFWVDIDDETYHLDGIDHFSVGVAPLDKHRVYTKEKGAKIIVVNIPPLTELT